MPLCMWVVNSMLLLEQSCIIKIHAKSTLKGKMIVTSQLICFPHSQVARLVLLQALKPNLNLSVLFDLAKKTKIIHVTKCVTSHPWLCNQVHLKEEKMNWARLRESMSIVHSPISGKRFVSSTFLSAVQGSIGPSLTIVGGYCHGKQEMNAASSEVKRSLKFSSPAEDYTARHAKVLTRGRG